VYGLWRCLSMKCW